MIFDYYQKYFNKDIKLIKFILDENNYAKIDNFYKRVLFDNYVLIYIYYELFYYNNFLNKTKEILINNPEYIVNPEIGFTKKIDRKIWKNNNSYFINSYDFEGYIKIDDKIFKPFGIEIIKKEDKYIWTFTNENNINYYDLKAFEIIDQYIKNFVNSSK